MKNLLPSLWNPSSSMESFEDPFRSLSRMQRQMDRLFGDFTTPSCEIEEGESRYLMSFDLPGVRKEDIKINLQNGTLTVTGQRKDECEERGKNHFHSERYYGSFSRSFILPADVKAEQVEAEYENGVLRVALPKSAAARGHQIKISEGRRLVEKVA